MNIRIATELDQKAWDSYVWNHPDAVAYHQFAWGRAVKNAYGFDPTYLIAEDAGRVVGVLPLVLMKVPFLGKKYVSLPYCDLGGVLSNDAVIADRLIHFSVESAHDANARTLELRSSATDECSSTFNKVCMVLRLPESSDQLMAGFKAKLRSQVKKPVKDGLTAEMGGLDLLDEFYRIVAINMRDLGSPVHSKTWYREVLKAYRENARVGLVRLANGTAVGAGLILLHKQVVSIPWASTLRDYNRYNPNMLLYWRFLSFAADNGYHFFDFGRSTLGEGTYKFKEQWGAGPIPLSWHQVLPQVSKDTPRHEKTGSASLRDHLECLWRQMPVPLATTLGSRLRGYISL